MLSKLHVRNYVLIDSLDIDFPEGLVIVTGQTGAGKSIMMGALSLVSGSRTDASVIGPSSDSCVVEAEFVLPSDDEVLRQIFSENDLDWDEGHLIIRRQISRAGRSRAFLNDVPVSLQILGSISSRLIDIHSQHQTLQLSDSRFQLSVLDGYAGNAALLSDYFSRWRRYCDIRSEIDNLDRMISRAETEKEYNEAMFRQLEQAGLRSGELEELELEHKMLSNAEDIKTYLCSAESVFSGEDTDSGVSVTTALKDAHRSLEKVSAFLPQALALAERLQSCRLELEDIAGEISSLNSASEVSPEKLQAVEDRISLIYGLMHRHSCRSVDELISHRDSLLSSISGVGEMQEKRASLSAELSSVLSVIETLSAQLHDSRVKAASSLSSLIQEKLHFLELPYAVFSVDVQKTALSSTGADTVSFLFSSVGNEPTDVSKCASGGEMSRIMLSLKSVMSSFQSMPTMVFDEIDTGVSGSVADKMGTMICEMGGRMQVFAITHLPQVAAKGDAHYVVTKNIDPVTSRAETTVKKLSAEQRVLEVARMLSGSVLSDAAIANARDLLHS